MLHHTTYRALALVLLLFIFTGCGDTEDDRLVGAECRGDRDCEEMCLQGNDYPGGFCSMRCGHSRDCPDSTACVEKDRGVCLFRCDRDSDCPRGWECEDLRREGQSGKTHVCIGD